MHDWRAEVRARLAGTDLDPHVHADVVDEIAQHLESQFAELAPALGPAAARNRLIAELRDRGFDQAVTSRLRRNRPNATDVWTRGSVVRDIRHGFRSLRRTPGMLAAGVVALALGIGLTTVMYSVIYGLVIKGLPFEDPSRIAMIYRADPTGEGREDLVPFGDFVRYRAEQRAFTSFGGYTGGTASVSGGDHPERVSVGRVTAGALDVTGARPVLGRVFKATDDAPGAPPTAIIAYAMWRDRFALDSGVLGKSLRVNDRVHVIVGVMPDGFSFPDKQKLWLPMQLDSAAFRAGEGTALNVVARLRPGASFEAANVELATLSERLSREGADTAATRTLAQPFVRATIPARVYSLLYAMLGAVFLVLLVACANVANLLLDRAVNRTREVAIRVALGASRGAVIRQSLVESSLLAAIAAVLGTVLAEGGVTAFNRAMGALQADLPFWTDIRLHAPVLVFVVAVAALASVASGLLPALHAARVDVNTILKDESYAASSRGVGRVSHTIVVAEIALSSALLVGAGFMTKSIVHLRALDPRFATTGVLTARVTLTSADSARQRAFFETLEQNLIGVSGLTGVYLGDGLPGVGWNGQSVAIEGRSYSRPQNRPVTRSLAVTPGFFRTFDVTTIHGRALLASDRVGSARVVVINEAFAHRQFPGIDPIGHRIRLGDAANAPWLTIVGVMPTLFSEGIQNHWPPEVVTALWQAPRIPSVSVAVRGPASVATVSTLRTAVGAIAPDVPVYQTLMMDEILARDQAPIRVFSTMFVIFGLVSLLLAAVGLYAVMAFSVSRRAREMGIRLALGATRLDVVRLIARSGAVQTVIGLVLGFGLGSLIVSGARAVLFDVEPGDPTVFGLVAVVLGAAAAVACLIPALGATRVDPIIALRSD